MSAPEKPDTPTPDHSVPGPIPAPVSADLATDSNDPQELRRLLDRAVERLSFYESFDRTIGETLRRTGEMMEETVALREQAKQAATEAEAARSAAEEAIRQERTRYRTLVEGALAEVRTARPVIDAMIARLEGALTDLSGDNGAENDLDTAENAPIPMKAPESADEPEFSDEHPAPDTTAEGLDIEASEPEPEPGESEEAIAAPEEDEPEHPGEEPTETDPEKENEAAAPEGETSPGMIDVIAHGVPSAATAIGLQQMLRELDTVSRVDAREFADGELRLQVECTAPFPEQPLADWLSQNSGSLVSRNGTSIELSFA